VSLDGEEGRAAEGQRRLPLDRRVVDGEGAAGVEDGRQRDTQLESGARMVTFFNGMKMREPIITLDEARRRLVWSAQGGATTHYNAALQVIADGEYTQVHWTSDFLPDAVEPTLSSMQDQGLLAMQRAFEG
jgi:hypothetical protein